MPRAVEVAGTSTDVISYVLTSHDAFTVLGLSVTHDLTGSASDGYIVARWAAPDGALIGWQKIGCGNGAGTAIQVATSALAPDVIVENTLGNLGVTQPLLQLPLIPSCSITLSALKLSDDSPDGNAMLSSLVLWVDDSASAADLGNEIPPYTALPAVA